MWIQSEEALESFLLFPAKLALRACFQAAGRLAAFQRAFCRRLRREFFRDDYHRQAITTLAQTALLLAARSIRPRIARSWRVLQAIALANRWGVACLKRDLR